MSVLAQKNILVGVSGGIAAYKIPLLIRQLIKLNCKVKVVMTPSSKEFVTPLTLSTVSNNDVFSEFTTQKNNNPTWNNHVDLGIWADLFVIAPLTANTLSKMASGTCDNILLATYFSLCVQPYFHLQTNSIRPNLGQKSRYFRNSASRTSILK